MPVLPLVESRITRLWLSLPERSPSSIMLARGAVLHRPAGVEVLGLAEDLDVGEFARDALQAQQRRIADGGEQRLGLGAGKMWIGGACAMDTFLDSFPPLQDANFASQCKQRNYPTSECCPIVPSP